MNWWFIAIMALYGCSVGVSLAKDGEPKDEEYSFIKTLIASIICGTIIYFAIKTGF